MVDIYIYIMCIYIYLLWNYQWSLSLSICISLTGSLDSQTGQRSKLASMTVAFGLDRLLVGGEGYSVLESHWPRSVATLCVSRPTYLDFRLLGYIALDAILANTVRLPLAAWKRLQVRGRGGTSAASVKSIHTGSGATKTNAPGIYKTHLGVVGNVFTEWWRIYRGEHCNLDTDGNACA